MIDYDVIRVIWWAIIGVVLMGFVITDGFDMGVGILLPIIGKSNVERRIMVNSIAPHWDGNQVWLITGGAALFAAWPYAYAATFSGFYMAMILVLACLWLRPLSFDYRSKIEDTKWRNTWDTGIFLGSFVPALVFGVAFGNLLQGIPIQFDILNNVTYAQGENFFLKFLYLLNPFAILAGVVSLTLIITHGGAWLQMKTKGELYLRARKATQISAIVMLIAFILAGVWVAFGIDGYRVASEINYAGPSVLLKETVVRDVTWLQNYNDCPILWLVPVLGVICPILVIICSAKNKNGWGFLFSALSIAAVLFTYGVATFPFVVPAEDLISSLTIWNTTSSQTTLNIMFYVVLIFLPIVLFYTIWSYVKMFGRLDKEYVQKNEHSLY